MDQQILKPENIDLKELGKRLYGVDMLIVALLKRRMDLALQVGEYKIEKGQKIFRASVESKRLAQVRSEARKWKRSFLLGVKYIFNEKTTRISILFF